ncbi:MAG: hypothetical protein HY553_01950 [Elusimicrobia bacterium]|nr:hypothetical protein [Elusimicrobiota bacterium]
MSWLKEAFGEHDPKGNRSRWRSAGVLAALAVVLVAAGLLHRQRDAGPGAAPRLPVLGRPFIVPPPPKDDDAEERMPSSRADEDETIDALLNLLKPSASDASPELQRRAETARTAFEAEPAIRRHYERFARAHPKPTKQERRDFHAALKRIPEFRRLAERFYSGGVPAAHLAVLSGARGPAAQAAALNAMGLPASVARIPSFQEAAQQWRKYAKEKIPSLSPDSSVNLIGKGEVPLSSAGRFSVSRLDAEADSYGPPSKVNLGGGGGGGGGGGSAEGPAAHDVDPELSDKLKGAHAGLGALSAGRSQSLDQIAMDGRIKKILELYPWLSHLGLDVLRQAISTSGMGDLIQDFGVWGGCFAMNDPGSSDKSLFDKCLMACEASKRNPTPGKPSCGGLPKPAWKVCVEDTDLTDLRCLKLCNAVKDEKCAPEPAVVQKYCNPNWEWVEIKDADGNVINAFWKANNPQAPKQECHGDPDYWLQYSNAAGDAPSGSPGPSVGPTSQASNVTTTQPGTSTTNAGTTTTSSESTTSGSTPSTTAPQSPAPRSDAQLHAELISECGGKSGWSAILCYDNASYRNRGTPEDSRIGAAAYYEAAKEALKMAQEYVALGDSQRAAAMADLARDHFGKATLVGGSVYGTYAQAGYEQAKALNPDGKDTSAKAWGDWWPPEEGEDPFSW